MSKWKWTVKGSSKCDLCRAVYGDEYNNPLACQDCEWNPDEDIYERKRYCGITAGSGFWDRIDSRLLGNFIGEQDLADMIMVILSIQNESRSGIYRSLKWHFGIEVRLEDINPVIKKMIDLSMIKETCCQISIHKDWDLTFDGLGDPVSARTPTSHLEELIQQEREKFSLPE